MEMVREPLLDSTFELSLQRVDTRIHALENMNAECAALLTKVSIRQPHILAQNMHFAKQPKYAGRVNSNLISL